MRHWKFTYVREYGKGRTYSKYVGDYSFPAEDLYEAYRVFGLWMRGQPYGRNNIRLLHWVEMEPPTEQSGDEENMKIRATKGAFVLPAEGDHKAELIDYEDLGMQPDPYNEGEEKQRMKLVYKLEGGSRQYQWVTVSLHPASKFYQVATALLNAFPPEEIDVDTLKGKRCWLTIKHRTTDDGKKYANVVDTRPLLPEDGAPRFDGSRMKSVPPSSVKVQRSRSWPAARNTASAVAEPSPSKESQITDDDIPF